MTDDGNPAHDTAELLMPQALLSRAAGNLAMKYAIAPRVVEAMTEASVDLGD